MTAIIDYDAGNIRSVEKAFRFLGEEAYVTRDRSQILEADRVVLPGVGAFGDAMGKLCGLGLDEIIWETVDKGTPFLGICLGLQLLFERSEESGGVAGLGILKGEILRIPEKTELKIPHIGWNSLSYPNKSRLMEGIPENSYAYFVHSYYLQAAEPEIVKATAEYGVLIHASVEKDHIFACQFHPEKSSDVGMTILKNFLDIPSDCQEEDGGNS